MKSISARKKTLSQEKLAYGLEGIGLPGYRGVNISWWEHAKRNLPDRVVVVGLIQVLQRYNGIRLLLIIAVWM